MLKTAFIIYRQWGYEIFKKIYEYQFVREDFVLHTLIIARGSDVIVEKKYLKHINVFFVDPKDQKTMFSLLKKQKVSLVFLYSWSFIISTKIFNNFTCLCLHPSKLPKFRGGTPIQNQLTRNVMNSAVSIFKMNESIDGGDVYQQADMSLLGDVTDIFSRMVDLGTQLTKQLITDAVNQELIFVPQRKLKRSRIYQRRKPEQSEISWTQTQKLTFEKVNNLVRGLLSPYPSAYLMLRSGKLYLTRLEKYMKLPKKVEVINQTSRLNNKKKIKNYFLPLKDSYAKLINYKFEKSL